MLGRFIPLILLAVVFILPLVSAGSYCVGDLLWQEITYNLTNGTHTMSLVINKSQVCESGCADNGVECKTPKNVSDGFFLAAGLGLSVIAAMFAFYGTKAKDKPFQILFIGSSILTLLSMVGLFTGFSMANQSQVLSAILQVQQMVFYVFVLIMGWFILSILANIVYKMRNLK